jgi:hypothetical protein
MLVDKLGPPLRIARNVISLGWRDFPTGGLSSRNVVDYVDEAHGVFQAAGSTKERLRSRKR